MKFSTLVIACLSMLSVTALAQNFTVSTHAPKGTSMHRVQFSTAAALPSAKTATPHKAAKHPVTETPEGTLKEYSLHTVYYDGQMDEWIDRDGIKSDVVFDGNTVWIKAICTTFMENAWIKGEISDDKTKVVFENNQVYRETDDGYKYYICLSYADENDNIKAETEEDEFSFKYDAATGVLDGSEVYLSLVNEDGGVFSFNEGYIYTPFTGKLIEAPANAKWQAYTVRYENVYKYYIPTYISVAQDGKDFYFKGLSSKTPESILKGTQVGDSIIIDNGQYVGTYDDLYYLYFKGATFKEIDDYGYPVYGNKDYACLNISKDENGELQFDGNDGILFALGTRKGASYSESYPTQKMRIFHAVPAKPATPEVRYLSIDMQYKVTTSMAYVIPATDINGKEITPDSLEYHVFIDDKVYHFDPDWYPMFVNYPEWVPANFSDRGMTAKQRTDHNGSYHVLAFDHEESLGYTTVGLQSRYTVNGVTNYSDIVTFDIATETSTIKEVASGIKSVSSDNVVGEMYYDLSGRQVNNAQKGVFIKTTTFSDGSRKSIKVLK